MYLPEWINAGDPHLPFYLLFSARIIISDGRIAGMEPILAVAIVMIWIVAAVILYMTYLGYDVRSRGFESNGIVPATLPMLGITIKDYYRKRAEHPVTDETLAKKAKVSLILMTIVSVVAVAMTISLFFI